MNHSPLPIPIALVFDALAGLISGAANVVPMSRGLDGPVASNQELLDFHERSYEFKHLGLSRILDFSRNPSSLFCGVGPHRPSTGARSGNRLPARVSGSGYPLNFVHTGRRGLCPMQS